MTTGVHAEAGRLGARSPGPGSLTWRYSTEWRSALTSRSTLLLQVAHPVVGAGVADHSEFLEDRWDRLRRTARSATLFLGYGGPDAANAEGTRLREVHKGIKGVDKAGRRYHALNPEAYLWVHATLFHHMVQAQRFFGRPLTESAQQRLYTEWQAIALVLGITDRHIPADLAAFRSYFSEMVEQRLEDNDSVRLILKLDEKPFPPPPGWPMPEPVWTALGTPPAAVLRLATAGTLPSALRERFGIPWTGRHQRRLSALAAITRATDLVLPEVLRYPPETSKAIRAARRSPSCPR